jgi:hypothetical protein
LRRTDRLSILVDLLRQGISPWQALPASASNILKADRAISPRADIRFRINKL